MNSHKNNQILIISSDDSYSQRQIIPKSIPIFSYDDILNFKKLTKSLLTYQLYLKQFIQNSRKKVLFIFGASGTGKTMMAMNFLNDNDLKYQIKGQQSRQFQDEDLQNCIKLKSLKQVILECLTDGSIQYKNPTIHIFYDYPLKTDQNYQQNNFSQIIRNNIHKSQTKIIFILNSQIYNPYYILNSSKSQTNLQNLKEISVIKIKGYNKTQIKQIIIHFIKSKPIYQLYSNKQIINQIAQLSNGDARKALHQLYWLAMTKQTSKKFNKKKLYFDNITLKENQKNKIQKTSLFHMIGKFLYAKRLDPNTNKSKYFTQEEIKYNDPPFYFNPVEILFNSRISLKIFHDLLQENYLSRFGSIKDIKHMARLFRDIDITFGRYVMSGNLIEGIQGTTNRQEWAIGELLGWGSLIYNKNSILTDKHKLTAFKRSQWNSLIKQIKNRKQLIHRFFKDSILKNWIIFANLSNNYLKKSQICKILSKRLIQNIKIPIYQDVLTLNQNQQINYYDNYFSTEEYFKKLQLQRNIKLKRYLTLDQVGDDSDVPSDQ